MEISFKDFLKLDKDHQKALGNIINEELKPSVKKRKMKELEKLLKAHDFLYHYQDGDYKEWRRQNDMAQDIRKLKDLIGDDAVQLYKIYAKKGGCWDEVQALVDKQKTITDRIEDVKEKHSLFPEMEQVQRDIALGFQGEGKVLANKHHFTTGNPYENAEKWIEPSPKRQRGWQDK